MSDRFSRDSIALLSQRGDPNEGETPGSKRYAIIVCIFASLGGLFFGYDQGVTGGVLVMDSFKNDFCVGYEGMTASEDSCYATDAAKIPDAWLGFQTMFNVTYYIGCILGAFLAGYICDKFGRRWTIFLAGAMFTAGTFWVIFTPAHKHNIALSGRVLEGLGVGCSSFSLPIFGAEMAPKELRGMLSGFMQMTVVTGIFAAGAVNLAVEHMDNGWRVTNAVAVAAPIIVMLGIFFVPESPRWLYQAKGKEAARESLKKLRETDNVEAELRAIGDALESEGYGQATLKDVLDPKIRRRLFIAVFLQLLQQATGINPMFTYGGVIFQQIVGDGIISLLIFQIVNFCSTIPAMYWVDRYGRRYLLLIGAVGMVIGHLASGIAFSVGCSGDTEDTGCSDAAGYSIIVFTAFFIFNFAISWGPVCWIYPAEIFPTALRAKAVSLSTMMNWIMGAVMIAIPKLFPLLNINGVFFLFGVLCTGAGAFVYFYCPETKGMLLEDIEFLFNGENTDPTPVKNAASFASISSPKRPHVEA